MQTRIDPAKKTALYSFDSLGEFAGWIKDAPKVWGSAYNVARTQPMSKRWDLNAGYDAAVNMARNGWLEGATRAQDALKTFPAMSPQPDTRTDVYGFRPHVPRFCAGAPDSMIRHADKAETGAGRVLTLAVSLDANAHTDADCMANFGVACAQYVNQLETDGTRVELIGVLVATYAVSGWRTVQAITIKKADQPLDLAVVAFAIGHPAMLRRLGFAAIERMPVPPASNYGSAANARLSDLINCPPGAVILNGMKEASTHAPTAAKGLEFVSRVIENALKTQEL
jgi:hypothetical protein